MDGTFDIQRDHAALLDDVLAVCSGVVWFSTNRRRFKLKLPDDTLAIDDLTHATIPPDFRDQKIHHAYPDHPAVTRQLTPWQGAIAWRRVSPARIARMTVSAATSTRALNAARHCCGSPRRSSGDGTEQRAMAQDVVQPGRDRVGQPQIVRASRARRSQIEAAAQNRRASSRSRQRKPRPRGSGRQVEPYDRSGSTERGRRRAATRRRCGATVRCWRRAQQPCTSRFVDFAASAGHQPAAGEARRPVAWCSAMLSATSASSASATRPPHASSRSPAASRRAPLPELCRA